MRIAVIADIHGNLPALEAVLDDIAARGIARVVNLGDCASGLLWPRETAALLMARAIPTVRGNHDRWLAEQEPAAMGRQDAFAHAETTPEQRAWLGALPARLDPAPGVLACHGTPESDTTNLLEEPAHGHLRPAAPERVRERLGAEGRAARVVLCGHSHQPSVVRLPDGGPLVVNPGSLGCPAFRVTRAPHPHRSEARSPHARYAILHLSADGGAPSADLIALRYDWEAAARRAESLGSPAWAYALRTGFLPDGI
ncbi:metallophosphoesterase family protein [Caldovatus aquaticus]|uniref:Metallophosphatase family protein n=1 Tax=Caldovatus aquaticus TaxID=2865671 RepID=A0ABS7F5Q3_9PROT|nr:metallophosphoesterase family protein [Caldovatus aquaticus]MBW8270947.1 metallophosphatase family protein [Caldovatus aquaticus]